MAHPLRIEFPNALYHVTSRGDRREPIFEDDEDRAALLEVVGAALDRFDASVLAWCFMGNHYRLLVHTRAANLSLVMRHINGVYSQRYNRRHGLVGHLFQGRFKAVLVDREAYLLEVCRYIELNPVRARMVTSAGDWAWSSFAAHTGLANAPAWLDRLGVWQTLLGREVQSPKDAALAAERYASHVAAGHAVRLWDEALRQQIYLGDAEFVARMQAAMSAEQEGQTDIPRAQRAAPMSVRQWLDACADRDEALVRAHRESHHSLSDIAREVGLSVSRVSRIVAKWGMVLAKCKT
ncbi:transposase [Roseateles sp. BYS180W]|uniref:Transposase n=1 Tax=Roseateles rivi TaxID=3299028 RepID=A0ABW7FYJ8_9BURK